VEAPVRDSNEIEAAFTKWMARPEGTTTGVSILATELDGNGRKF